MAEIETGVSWRLSPRVVLTGGWLVQSWWDLGLQETMSTNDDANILGFDGFFALRRNGFLAALRWRIATPAAN